MVLTIAGLSLFALGGLRADDAAKPREAASAGRGDVLLACDFEDADWWRAWGATKQPVNTALVEGEEGVRRQRQEPAGHGASRAAHGTTFGYKFRQRICAEPEEIYFRYYLKFDPDWKNATSGGKLPGISGTTQGRVGRPAVNGSDGWSARGLYVTRNGADSTTIGFYCYHADMRGNTGSTGPFSRAWEHGRWYCVEEYCKLNTPGTGGAKGARRRHPPRLDRRQAGVREDRHPFPRRGHAQIEEVWVNVYHGGETPVPREDIHLYLDNMVIARQPIGQ